MNKYLALLLILPVSSTLADTDRKWITELELSPEIVAELHWVAVHEGEETVEKILLKNPKNKKALKEYKVFGQPHFSKDNTLVALPYCADDGCENTVKVIDLLKLSDPKEFEFEARGIETQYNWKNRDTLEIVDKMKAYPKNYGIKKIWKYSFSKNQLSFIKDEKWERNPWK